MGTFAFCLSKQEKVEIEAIFDSNPSFKFGNMIYQAKQKDGTITMIDRGDIILDEEQVLIDELADILYQSKSPVQNKRYSIIMKHFIFKGVPYVRNLSERMPKQQSLDFFVAG